MTPQEAYKIGFLHKCAEDGLTVEEALQRVRTAAALVKAAAVKDWLPKNSGQTGLGALIGGAIGGGDGGGLAGTAAGAATGGAIGATGLPAATLKALLPLLILGPPAAGMAAGYGMSQASDDTFDDEDMRKRELMSAYEQATDQMKRTKRLQSA